MDISTESPVCGTQTKMRKSKKKSSSSKKNEKSSRVALEGYIEYVDDMGSESGAGGSCVGRTKSLTDEDLEELKGCLDLGFGFSYDEIPELCNTLPALELCYSMSQRFLGSNHSDQDPVTSAPSSSSSSSYPSVANWKISSPGDHPDEVKARLKYWAQAVACTVRLCR